MESLYWIGCKHGTDKSTHHQYMNLYEKYFNSFREQSFKLLEIGIDKYKSLRTWLEYFPNAHVMGIDILDYPSLDGRNTNYKISQDDKGLSTLFDNNFFRVVIDDGSHMMSHQIKSLGLLWDKVQPGGIYICEDLHTSFCTKNEFFDFKPTTFEVLKKLENIEIPGFYCSDVYIDCEKISSEIQSMEFFIRDPNILQDSQTCVIVKKS